MSGSAPSPGLPVCVIRTQCAVGYGDRWGMHATGSGASLGSRSHTHTRTLSVGSRGSRPSQYTSAELREASKDKRIDPAGVCVWNKMTAGDQADIVAEIGRAVLNGEWPSSGTWYKLNTVNERARVKSTVSVPSLPLLHLLVLVFHCSVYVVVVLARACGGGCLTVVIVACV